jgi:hypothetical protein
MLRWPQRRRQSHTAQRRISSVYPTGKLSPLTISYSYLVNGRASRHESLLHGSCRCRGRCWCVAVFVLSGLFATARGGVRLRGPLCVVARCKLETIASYRIIDCSSGNVAWLRAKIGPTVWNHFTGENFALALTLSLDCLMERALLKHSVYEARKNSFGSLATALV